MRVNEAFRNEFSPEENYCHSLGDGVLPMCVDSFIALDVNYLVLVECDVPHCISTCATADKTTCGCDSIKQANYRGKIARDEDGKLAETDTVALFCFLIRLFTCHTDQFICR